MQLKINFCNDFAFLDGDLDELVDELNEGKMLYAGIKVMDPNTNLPKIVFINWVIITYIYIAIIFNYNNFIISIGNRTTQSTVLKIARTFRQVQFENRQNHKYLLSTNCTRRSCDFLIIVHSTKLRTVRE